jgi:preprotein translocase subunit SecA
MFNWIIKKIVGSKNQRELRRMQPLVRQINEIQQGLARATDDDLRAKTAKWKEELSAIKDDTFSRRVWMRFCPKLLLP